MILLYSHNHCRVFHYTATWSELLDRARCVKAPCSPVIRISMTIKTLVFVFQKFISMRITILNYTLDVVDGYFVKQYAI